MTDPFSAHHPRRWAALAVLVAAQFMFVVDVSVVNVAIPSIRHDLAASGAGIEAVVATYQIAFATVLITGGRLGDIYGRKKLFLAGLLGFTGASLWCGAAGSILALIAARIVQGAAAGVMVPQVLASIQDLFPPTERSRAFGVFGVALGLGGAVGLILGGWVVTVNLFGLGWRAAFLVNVPVGLLAAAAAFVLVPAAPPERRARLDLPGAAVLLAGIVLVLGPILFGRDLGWAWPVWVLFAAGWGVLASFLCLEAAVRGRGGSPLLDITLLGNVAFMIGLAATFSFYIGLTAFFLVLTFFLQMGLHFSALATGLAMAPLSLAFLTASRMTAGSGQATEWRLPAGAAILAASLVVLGALVWAVPHPAFVSLALPLALYGFGEGLVVAPLVNSVLARALVTPGAAGAVSGVLVTIQQIAGAAGIAVIGTVYFAVARAYPANPDRVAFLVSLLALLAMAGLATWLLQGLQARPLSLPPIVPAANDRA